MSNPNELIMCPYDNGHLILAKRLSSHLVRCRRNFTKLKMVHCPFNNTHIMHPSKLDEHITVCENRKKYDSLMNPDLLPKSTVKSEITVECGEDWDNEPEVETYDPAKYCERNLIIRDPKGLPPASRRQFREEQRQRFREAHNERK